MQIFHLLLSRIRIFFFLGIVSLFLIPFFESLFKGWAYYLLLFGTILVCLPLIKLNIRLDKTEKLIFGFLLAATISTIFSWSFSRSFPELVRYLAYFLIFIRVRRLEMQGRQMLSAYFLFAFSFYILIFGSFLIYFTIIQPQHIDGLDGLNFFYPVYGHGHLAGLLLLGIPYIFGWLLVNSRKYSAKLVLPLFCIIFFGIISFIFCFSRSGYILLMFYLIVLFLFKKNSITKGWKYTIPVFILLLFLIFQFIFFYSLGSNNYLSLPGQLFKPITYSDFRTEYLTQAWKGFRTSPLIGTGPDTYAYVSAMFKSHNLDYFMVTTAHNYFAQVFSETGLAGGLLLLAFLTASYLSIFRHNQKEPITYSRLSILIAVTITLINNLVDYDTQFMSILLWVFTFIALLLPAHKEEYRVGITSMSVSVFIPFLVVCYITLSGSAALVISGYLSRHPQLKISGVFPGPGLVTPWNAYYFESLSHFAIREGKFGESDYYNSRALLLDNHDFNILIDGIAIKENLGDYESAININLRLIHSYPIDSIVYKSLYGLYQRAAKSKLDRRDFAGAAYYLQESERIFPKAHTVSSVLVAGIGNHTDLNNAIVHLKGEISENEEAFSQKSLTLYDVKDINLNLRYIDKEPY